MQLVNNLYPYTSYALHYAEANFDENSSSPQKGLLPAKTAISEQESSPYLKDAQLIKKQLPPNTLSTKVLKTVCRIVDVEKKNSAQAVRYKVSSSIDNSITLSPLNEKTRTVFVSLHKNLAFEGAQGVKFTDTLMLIFDADGRFQTAKSVIKMTIHFKENAFELQRRVAIMQMIKQSPNFPENYGFFRKQTQKLYIYQERAVGDLITYDANVNSVLKLPQKTKISILQQITAALADLHSAGILHRDLKFENILIFNQPSGEIQAKLTDLGLACKLSDTQALSMKVGSIPFLTPSLIQHVFLDAPAPQRGVCDDLWALGIIIYYFSHGKVPGFQHELHKIMETNTLEERTTILTNWENELASLPKAPQEIKTLQELSYALLQASPISLEEVQRILKDIT